MLARSNLHLTFSPDMNSKSGKKYVSKSRKTFKRHPLRWQHLHRTSLMGNKFSLLNQARGMNQVNGPYSDRKNTPGKIQKDKWQLRKLPHWQQMLKKYKNRCTLYVVFHEGNQSQCWIRVETNVFTVSQKLKLKILGQPNDEVLLITDRRYKK